jgi:DnaJ like chaperone protein
MAATRTGVKLLRLGTAARVGCGGRSGTAPAASLWSAGDASVSGGQVRIWGKIVGAAAGLALGGPLGALIGTVGGHAVDLAVDAYAGAPASLSEDPTQQVAFTIAAIALAAKMAKADGDVTADETLMFRRIFSVAPEEEKNLAFVYDLARRSTYGYESYARQVAGLLRDRPALLEELLGGLFLIAVADGRLHPEEDSYLHRVAAIFGFDEEAYQRIRAQHVGADALREDDPYRILGLDPALGTAELKAGWLRLVRENHPDALVAQGLPDEFIAIATAKLARINAAWDAIADARGVK